MGKRSIPMHKVTVFDNVMVASNDFFLKREFDTGIHFLAKLRKNMYIFKKYLQHSYQIDHTEY